MLDKMDRIGTIMLLMFVFYVKKIAVCNNDTFAIAGCNVSLHWTLLQLENTTIPAFRADILHSLGNKTAHLSDTQCNIMDNSSSYCSTSERDDQFIISLDMFNVTARQNGNYMLQEYKGIVKTNTSSINLVVIGKPKIKEVLKPILNQTFQMTCDTLLGFFEGLMYKWRINGTDITPPSNVNAHSISSLGMDDNFNHVTCQVCLNETASNFSSVICEHDRCSVESDPHTIQVIYGPNNISLSLSESHFYLKDDEFFTIDCSAKCNPNCTFRWKGQDTIDNKKLILTSFESGMAGQYTCHVTNQQTNITSKSNPIVLHHVKENKLKEENTGAKFDLQTAVIGMGLVGVAILLVVIGFLLVRQWCKNASNKTVQIDSRILNQPVVNLRAPTNGEMSQGISMMQNRPLPVPNAQEATSRRPQRTMYPHHKRKSRSLHNLLDSAQNSFYPFSGDLLGRSHRNGTQDYNSKKRRLFSNCQENQLGDIRRLENGRELDVLYAKVRKDKKTNRDQHSTGAKSVSLNDLRHESFEQEPQEELYSTIDEDALSVFDDVRDNNTNANSNDEQRNTRHGESDYDYADLPVL